MTRFYEYAFADALPAAEGVRGINVLYPLLPEQLPNEWWRHGERGWAAFDSPLAMEWRHLPNYDAAAPWRKFTNFAPRALWMSEREVGLRNGRMTILGPWCRPFITAVRGYVIEGRVRIKKPVFIDDLLPRAA